MRDAVSMGPGRELDVCLLALMVRLSKAGKMEAREASPAGFMYMLVIDRFLTAGSTVLLSMLPTRKW